MDTTQILPDLNNISCKGNFLEDFVENFTDGSYIRDAVTRKYLLANHRIVVLNGLEHVNNIIGATSYDIWIDDMYHRKSRLNLNSSIIKCEHDNAKLSEEFEKQLLITRHPSYYNSIRIYFNGLISFEKTIKIPIFSSDNKKIIACLTVLQNLTPQLPIAKTFDLYQKYYSGALPKVAIQKTLEHFGLDHLFSQKYLPTYSEIRVLLAMHEDSRAKVIAHKLDCAVSTAQNHISSLQGKILTPFTLHNVLSQLRTAGQNPRFI